MEFLYKYSGFLKAWVNCGFTEESKIKKNAIREQRKLEWGAKCRLAGEVRGFCMEKYGTPYPDEIECGQIRWLNVPVFALSHYPTGLKMIPYLVIDDLYELSAIDDLKQLNSEQLELLGIKFSPYHRRDNDGSEA